MLEVIAQITLVLLGVALIAAFARLVKGPTLPDRIVAMEDEWVASPTVAFVSRRGRLCPKWDG